MILYLNIEFFLGCFIKRSSSVNKLVCLLGEKINTF